MVAVATRMIERAEEVFTDLGYTVSSDGEELRAERKWRVVRVTALDDDDAVPRDGGLRCFVAPERRANTLRERLLDAGLEYDWAILSVERSGDSYEVLHPSATSAV